MKTEEIKELIQKYYEGKTSLEEERQLRIYFQREDIPEDLELHASQFEYFFERQSERPIETDPFAKINFDESESIASTEKVAGRVGFSKKWLLRIAAGFILLLIGFSAGQFLSKSGASEEQVAALRQEVQQMKEALMYSGNYQQASAGERLSAVKLSTELSSGKKLDQQITDILIYTMNNDKSVNVRLAAAEALFQFRDEIQIQKALVNSLNRQKEPQMQILLIDMLVQLKAKGALNEMNRLLMDSDTREIVRERLKVGIAELKT